MALEHPLVVVGVVRRSRAILPAEQAVELRLLAERHGDPGVRSAARRMPLARHPCLDVAHDHDRDERPDLLVNRLAEAVGKAVNHRERIFVAHDALQLISRLCGLRHRLLLNLFSKTVFTIFLVTCQVS